MVSIITAPSRSGNRDNLTAGLTETRRRYTCESLSQGRRPGKQEARNRLIAAIVESEAFRPDAEHGAIQHALTLPGPWWHFEQSISKRLPHFYWTGIETVQSLFRLAAIRMPRGFKSEDDRRFASVYKHKSLGCDVVRGLGAKLLNCDLHRYLSVTEHRFGLIWMDLCAPLSRRIMYSVCASAKRLDGEGAVFAITLQAAREQIPILMEMGGAQNRLDFIGDTVRALLGKSIYEVNRFRYSDGAPMVQFIFQRDSSRRSKPIPRHIKPLATEIMATYETLPQFRVPDEEAERRIAAGERI